MGGRGQQSRVLLSFPGRRCANDGEGVWGLWAGNAPSFVCPSCDRCRVGSPQAWPQGLALSTTSTAPQATRPGDVEP